MPAGAPPGSVTGRVTYAVPGRSERRPAVNAAVSLLGTGNQVVTNPAGVFTLPDVDVTEGLVHFRFDSDGDGVVDRQRVLELADYGAGPHRAIDVGEVVLGENAAVSGRVLRADLGAARSGHGGTTVFVPEGPFSAMTSDDGSYLLPALPSGPLQFYVYRVGYSSVSLGTVELRSGEELRFRDVVLQLDTGPQAPGSLAGRLAFSPAAEGSGDAVVELSNGAMAALDADAAFRFASVPPGLYTLEARRTGYSEAVVPNVLVLPGAEASVGTVLLTDRPAPDAGQLPSSDAGMMNPPSDAGVTDAGVTDAGMAGDAGTPCGSTAQCGTGEWCDEGRCQPQCSATVTCSAGRTCDLATNTCVRTCAAGCLVGTSCHAASGLCRAECDLSFGCAAGFSCVGGACLPECGVGLPACPAHRMCRAGACVPDLTCDDDLDCPSDTMCRNARCDARPTAPSDAGAFTCSQPCHCRLGEWCNAGLCAAERVLTRFVTADGGVSLQSVLSAAGPDAVIALRAGDTFWSETPFRFGPGADRAVLAGGYVDCGAASRRVRSDGTRTTLAVDGGLVLELGGSGGQPVLDLTAQNLRLETGPSTGGCTGQLTVANAQAPKVRFIDGVFPAGRCGNATQALVDLFGVGPIDVSDVTVGESGFNQGSLRAVRVNGAYGTVRNASFAPQATTLNTVDVVTAENVSGPLEIIGTRVPPLTVTGSMTGVSVANAVAQPILVEDSVIAWPSGQDNGSAFIGIDFGSSTNVTVRDNVIDGAAQTGQVHSTGIGIRANPAAGVVSGNRIFPPIASSTGSVRIQGIYAASLGGALTISDNVMVGGQTNSRLEGIVVGSGTGASVTIQRNVIFGGVSLTMRGIWVTYGTSHRILDNDVSVSGNGTTCAGGPTIALELHDGRALIERNRLAATNAEAVAAVKLTFNSGSELYGNHLWAGPNTCFMSNPRSMGLWCSECGQVFVSGNTIEAEGSLTMPGATEGMSCEGSTPRLFAESNVIGGGSAPTHRIIAMNGGSCLQPDFFLANYLWHRSAAGFSTGERAFEAVDAGVGVLDGRGNLLAGNVSPFEAVQPLRPDGGTFHDFRLAAGSLAVDRGRLPVRQADGSAVTLDLFGLPRDAGQGVDIGCCERR
mgnify:CR=1 FL=1